MPRSCLDVDGNPLHPETELILHHEHLHQDLIALFETTQDHMSKRRVAESDVASVRAEPFLYRDNLTIGGEDVIGELEVLPARTAIVDVTPVDLARSARALREMSARTDVQIFMGCGHYVEAARVGPQPRSTLAYRDEILVELEEGTEGIRAAVIGEIGVSNPISDLERMTLRGAALAQAQSGAPLYIHIPGWEPNAAEALDVALEAGADPERCLVCHLDWSLPDLRSALAVLKRGAWVGFDTWGDELKYGSNQQPSDGTRIDALLELADRGYAHRVLHSHDTALKTQLSQHGGPGYGHIVNVTFPALRARGLSGSELRHLFVEPAIAFLGSDWKTRPAS